MTVTILDKAQLEATLKFFRRDIRGQWEGMDTECVENYNNIIKVMEHQIEVAEKSDSDQMEVIMETQTEMIEQLQH